MIIRRQILVTTFEFELQLTRSLIYVGRIHMTIHHCSLFHHIFTSLGYYVHFVPYVLTYVRNKMNLVPLVCKDNFTIGHNIHKVYSTGMLIKLKIPECITCENDIHNYTKSRNILSKNILYYIRTYFLGIMTLHNINGRDQTCSG